MRRRSRFTASSDSGRRTRITTARVRRNACDRGGRVTDENLLNLASLLGERPRERAMRAAPAESCTGGLVAGAITSIAGSSDWFDRGFVTYSNEAKIDLLGVSPETLARSGAVSEATVREMAAGALSRSRADIAV